MALSRTPQRLGGDVDPHRVGPYTHELGGKAPIAAAHVKDSRARRDMFEQESAPAPLICWFQPLRHTLP
jgi:hypothetical protein